MASLENFRLVVFRRVAEQLSFRRAAEDLYLTQPAVSLQIKALEEDLGVQLFDRTGAHIVLTDAGAVLLGYTHQVHALMSQAEDEIAALTGDHSGELAVGASTTIAQYVLPRLLADFKNDHPKVSLTLISGNTEEIVQALEAQKIAIACIEGPARNRDVRVESFLSDELLLIVPAAHEWAEHGSVTPDEICNFPLLMRERGSGTRHVLERELERLGVKRRSLRVLMELDSTEAIKSAVEAGLGAGFVSRWALAKDSRLGSGFNVAQIAGLRVLREFFVAHMAGPEPQGITGEFRRFLLDRTNYGAVAEAHNRKAQGTHKRGK